MPDSSVVSSTRMRSNGHNLNRKKLHFNTRKNFCTLRVGTGCSGSLWSPPPWSPSTPTSLCSCVTCSR